MRTSGKGAAPDIIRRGVGHFLISNDGTKKTVDMFRVPRSTLSNPVQNPGHQAPPAFPELDFIGSTVYLGDP